MASSLTIEKVDAAYGAVRVLEGVTIDVKSGETVVLLGTNGNGKSTLMKCIMGIVRPSAGRIMAAIDGVQHDLTSLTTEQIVDLGIALVPEGRRLFPKLTVEENLALGAFRPTARAQIKQNLNACYETFPRLPLLAPSLVHEDASCRPSAPRGEEMRHSGERAGRRRIPSQIERGGVWQEVVEGVDVENELQRA